MNVTPAGVRRVENAGFRRPLFVPLRVDEGDIARWRVPAWRDHFDCSIAAARTGGISMTNHGPCPFKQSRRDDVRLNVSSWNGEVGSLEAAEHRHHARWSRSCCRESLIDGSDHPRTRSLMPNVYNDVRDSG